MAFDNVNGPDEVKINVTRIENAIKEVERVRNISREQRRSLYEEARVYGENVQFNKTILKNVPDQIVVELKSFMAEYCRYFETDQNYRHLVDHLLNDAVVLLGTNQSSISGKSDARKRKWSITAVIDNILSKLASSVNEARENWAKAASAYYRLSLALQEHGISRSLSTSVQNSIPVGDRNLLRSPARPSKSSKAR